MYFGIFVVGSQCLMHPNYAQNLLSSLQDPSIYCKIGLDILHLEAFATSTVL